MAVSIFGRFAAPTGLSASAPKVVSKSPVAKVPTTSTAVGSKSNIQTAQSTLTAATTPKQVTTTINKVPATVAPYLPGVGTAKTPIVQKVTATQATVSGQTASLPSTLSVMNAGVVSQPSAQSIKPTVKQEEPQKSLVANMLQSSSGVSTKPIGTSATVVKDGGGLVSQSVVKPMPTFTQAPSILDVLQKTPTIEQAAPVYAPVQKPVSAYDLAPTAAGGKVYSAGSSAPASTLAAQSATSMFNEMVAGMATGLGPVFGQKDSTVYSTTKPVLPQSSMPMTPSAPPQVATIPSAAGATAAAAVDIPLGPVPVGPMMTAPAAKPSAQTAAPAPASNKNLWVGAGIVLALGLAIVSRGAR